MTYYKLKRFFIPVTFLIGLVASTGCKKFLDEKPKISQVVPHTLDNLQYLFNNSSLNELTSSSGYAELLADNYYLPDAYYQYFSGTNLIGYMQNYVWAPDAPSLGYKNFWDNPYQTIAAANTVLDQLPKIQVSSQDTAYAKALRGTGLFYRSFAFWSLAQVFARPYAPEYFSSPGVVLRLTSDVGIVPHSRATVKETYDQIIADLKEAASLLPVNVSLPTRPSQTAAYAELARVYLSMRDYQNSGYYANLALSQRSALFDYNLVQPVPDSVTYSFSFPNYNNPEMIFDNTAYLLFPLTGMGNSHVDTSLYRSYSNNDLRKALYYRFYNGDYGFYGTYNSTLNNDGGNIWDGLATDELYLTRAECSARAGNKDSAMNDLNRLLRARWKSGTYTDMTSVSATDALTKVLTERRKELVYRGLRWTDIRRLNVEGANITLKRLELGTIYTLPPNDIRSVMLIPQEEINLSGIQQNPR